MTTHPKFDVLFIDGDVVSFICAAAVQKNVQDEYGNVTAFGDLTEGKLAVDRMIAKFRKTYGKPDHVIRVALSDKDNWRWRVRADYKDNRDADGGFGNRPVLLLPLKAYVADKYKAETLPQCEADDTLSIWQTTELALDPHRDHLSSVIIGRDKDFKSIPGWHVQLAARMEDDPHVFEQSVADADRWHLVQSLAGDKTDGFDGCPGIGVLRAERIIDGGMAYRAQEGILTRGPNKGTRVIKWFLDKPADPWEIVVSCYVKAGLTEADALDSARMARLLRFGEYVDGKPVFWQPYKEQP